MHADGEDLSYVQVEALDANDQLCPLATNEVRFTLEGPASIAGVGNGDHHFPAEFDTNHVALFFGKAMLIVRSGERPGQIRIKASSPGLPEADCSLQTRAAR